MLNSIMSDSLYERRKIYDKGKLLEKDAPKEPIELFKSWFEFAHEEEHLEANAMTLATVDRNQQPSTRIVLLRAFDEQGFVFFTNYNSKKGKDLADNPKACLSFYWPKVERQVRIQGVVEKVSEEESNTYFNSRPEGSRAASIASNQSQAINSREELESSLEEVLKNGNLSRPKHWGGYRLVASNFEFWQGREFRLHDRLKYERVDDQWKLSRLSP